MQLLQNEVKDKRKNKALIRKRAFNTFSACLAFIIFTITMGVIVHNTLESQRFMLHTDSYSYEANDYSSNVLNSTYDSEFKININVASKRELMKLDGIGEEIADAIILYRNKNGNIISFDELTQIKGISSTLINKIKSHILL